MSNRLKRLRNILTQNDLDAIFISQSENRRYLSSFTGSAGFLFISQTQAILATDFRYVKQAQAEASEFELFQISNGMSQWFPSLISKLDIQRLGFEETAMSLSTYKELTGVLSETKAKIKLIPSKGIVESLRAIKNDEELHYIEEAARISDAALEGSS